MIQKAPGLETRVETRAPSQVVENMPGDCGFVIAAVAKGAERMAAHQYGCRIIQRMLENCDLEALSEVLDPVVEATGTMAKDLIQHLDALLRCFSASKPNFGARISMPTTSRSASSSVAV